MKIDHIVPSIADQVSGPAHSVPALCESLCNLPVEVTLHVLAPGPEEIPPYKLCTYPAWPILKRLGISPAMRRGLQEAAKSADILHSHSLWMMPNLYPAEAVRGTKCRLVVSPRGTLQSWALEHHRMRKILMWKVAQEGAIRAACCLHVTATSELQEVRALGLRQPVTIIPNGINIPSNREKPIEPRSKRRLLSIGRIHKKKGLENLLRAWNDVSGSFPDWELRILGRDDGGYERYLRSLIESLRIENTMIGSPVFGQEKSNAYFASNLYILPSHSENFGIVVAEALAHGVPVIASKGTPWQGLTTHGCGWWTENTPAALEACLREALALPPVALQQMGAAGRQWMLDEFSWPRIGRMMLDTYAWLLGNAPKPDWVEM